jgi:hypothetical protein
MLPNLELYLMTHADRLDKARRIDWRNEPPRRSWRLPKLRHLFLFW